MGAPIPHRRYTRDDEAGPADDAEETGWKYLHGDVFRFPEHVNLFSAMMGVGTQVGGQQGNIKAMQALGVGQGGGVEVRPQEVCIASLRPSTSSAP